MILPTSHNMRMKSLSKCDEEKENKILYITQELNTVNKNNELTSVPQITPISVDMVKETLHSINTYDIINDSDFNEEPIAESSSKRKSAL